MKAKPWTKLQIARLRDLHASGAAMKQIAFELNRNYSVVIVKVRDLHLEPKAIVRFPPEVWASIVALAAIQKKSPSDFIRDRITVSIPTPLAKK